MKQDHMILPDHTHLIEDGETLLAKINHDLKVATFFTGICLAYTIGCVVTGYRWFKHNR